MFAACILSHPPHSSLHFHATCEPVNENVILLALLKPLHVVARLQQSIVQKCESNILAGST